MFKENKETPMVVLIVLFIVFSVLILVYFHGFVFCREIWQKVECMPQWQHYQSCSASEIERLAKL